MENQTRIVIPASGPYTFPYGPRLIEQLLAVQRFNDPPKIEGPKEEPKIDRHIKIISSFLKRLHPEWVRSQEIVSIPKEDKKSAIRKMLRTGMLETKESTTLNRPFYRLKLTRGFK